MILKLILSEIVRRRNVSKSWSQNEIVSKDKKEYWHWSAGWGMGLGGSWSWRRGNRDSWSWK
jgi:hypothetical protein